MQQNAPSVLACSALKQKYRDRLAESLNVKYIWISLTPELALQRVASREGHFMPAALVDSQFATAETPNEAIILDASMSIEKLLSRCESALVSFVRT